MTTPEAIAWIGVVSVTISGLIGLLGEALRRRGQTEAERQSAATVPAVRLQSDLLDLVERKTKRIEKLEVDLEAKDQELEAKDQQILELTRQVAVYEARLGITTAGGNT